MGGSSSGKVGEEKQQVAQQQPQVRMQEHQAFSPQQQGLLAQQMQQGFGGSVQGQKDAMSFYQPMQTPQINRPDDIKQYLEALEVAKAAVGQKQGGLLGQSAPQAKGEFAGGSGGSYTPSGLFLGA